MYIDENTTVLGEIQQDAFSYATEHPGLFDAAVALFDASSADDTRPEVLRAIRNLNVTQLHKRITYSTSCSSANLAPRNDCYNLLAGLDSSTTFYYGNRRSVDFYGNCNLRLGPLDGHADSSEYAIHGIGKLIYSDCARQESICDCVKVSGYSPPNAGHRKICLSSKSTGCS